MSAYQAIMEIGEMDAQDDLLLIYFAGHGHSERLENGLRRGHIVMVDGGVSSKSPGVSMPELRDLPPEIDAKHVYFVIDACYSGLGFSRGIRVGPDPDGLLSSLTSRAAIQMITAGMEDELAADGLFTDAWLQALSGAGDFDHDGLLTAGEIGAFVRPYVSRRSSAAQTPLYGSLRGSGEVVFRLP